jgi:mRNA interferase MazF
MSVTRGDVVLTLFPFTDATGAKKRPALVVSCDRNNRRLNHAILALITSNTDRATGEPTQLLIDIGTTDGQQAGLLHASAVKCEHLVTIHERLIDRTIGRLSPALMQQIDQCLKWSLEIS